MQDVAGQEFQARRDVLETSAHEAARKSMQVQYEVVIQELRSENARMLVERNEAKAALTSITIDADAERDRLTQQLKQMQTISEVSKNVQPNTSSAASPSGVERLPSGPSDLGGVDCSISAREVRAPRGSQVSSVSQRIISSQNKTIEDLRKQLEMAQLAGKTRSSSPLPPRLPGETK